jgi:hypothetical protein
MLTGSSGVAARGEHEGEVVAGLAVAGPLVHRLLEITLRGFEITRRPKKGGGPD